MKPKIELKKERMELAEEEYFRLLTEELGVSESQARAIIAIECGNTQGWMTGEEEASASLLPVTKSCAA